METLKEMIENIDKALNEKHAVYVDLHKKLDEHRGKELSETDMDKVQSILQEIQDAFADIYNVLHFVMFRNQFAQNATREYNEFIEHLKENLHAEEQPKEGQA